MSLVSCKECNHQVGEKATKCPNCGTRLRKAKRGFFGLIFKWLFIIFNILMLVWIISALVGGGEIVNDATNEYEEAGAALGTALGMGVIITVWALGDVILGLFVLFTRAKD